MCVLLYPFVLSLSPVCQWIQFWSPIRISMGTCICVHAAPTCPSCITCHWSFTCIIFVYLQSSERGLWSVNFFSAAWLLQCFPGWCHWIQRLLVDHLWHEPHTGIWNCRELLCKGEGMSHPILVSQLLPIPCYNTQYPSSHPHRLSPPKGHWDSHTAYDNTLIFLILSLCHK